MRKLVWLVLALLLSSATSAAGLKVGDLAPDFSLLGLDGKKHALAELHAKGPALLFFWSTECSFCRAMAPRLQKLYAERAPDGLTVAGIDIDFNMHEQVKGFVQERKLEFLILHGSLDNADVVEAYGVPGTPTLVLVGRDGRVAYWGHSLDEATQALH